MEGVVWRGPCTLATSPSCDAFGVSDHEYRRAEEDMLANTVCITLQVLWNSANSYGGWHSWYIERSALIVDGTLQLYVNRNMKKPHVMLSTDCDYSRSEAISNLIFVITIIL